MLDEGGEDNPWMEAEEIQQFVHELITFPYEQDPDKFSDMMEFAYDTPPEVRVQIAERVQYAMLRTCFTLLGAERQAKMRAEYKVKGEWLAEQRAAGNEETERFKKTAEPFLNTPSIGWMCTFVAATFYDPVAGVIAADNGYELSGFVETYFAELRKIDSHSTMENIETHMTILSYAMASHIGMDKISPAFPALRNPTRPAAGGWSFG